MTSPWNRIGPGPVPDDATQHMVRMRDSVRLATDVYLPDEADQPGPTILTRLPYDKNGEYTFMPKVARYFTDRGYRVVVQDVRGKFRSEGETLLFVNEVYDGHDTLDWIVNQTWSDGIVGMWGDSYYGYTQWAAASSRHPALRAMVPRVTGTRLGELPVPVEGARHHDVEMGVFRVYPLTMFFDNDIIEWQPDWTRLPLADEVEDYFTALGKRSPSYDIWFPHPVMVRRFPAGSPFDTPAIPVLMTVGWWDNCAPWQWSDHQELQKRPGWAANEYLLLEAIDHENFNHFEIPEHRTAADDPTAMGRYLDPAIEFFDVFLRGSDWSIPRVRWQLANSGDPTFHQSATWPPHGVTSMRLYLSEPHVEAGTVGGLVDEPGSGGVAAWTHDASDPVPSPVTNAFAFVAENPDERGLAERDDVMVYDGGVLQQPLNLVGPITWQGTVASDGDEMDVFIRLVDVGPDGAAHLIARGQQTVLDATQALPLTIDLGHVAYQMQPEHRLRVTIASTDSPEFVPAPGTGEHRWLATKTLPNNQRLTLGGEDGARLTVTVLATF